MPAKPAVNAVAEIVLEYLLSEGVKAINRYFQRLSGGPLTTGQAASMATDTATAWNAHLAGSFLPDTTLTQVQVTDLTSDTAGQGLWSGSHVGTDSGAPLGAGTALIVSEKFLRRYRGGHPRIYFPAPAAAHLVDQQQWTSAFLAGWEINFAAYVTATEAITAGGIDLGNWVNVSYYHGFTNHTYPSGRVRPIPTLRSTPLVDDITSWVTQPKVGSQRRRNGNSP